jgi:hypothetical protein
MGIGWLLSYRPKSWHTETIESKKSYIEMYLDSNEWTASKVIPSILYTTYIEQRRRPQQM